MWFAFLAALFMTCLTFEDILRLLMGVCLLLGSLSSSSAGSRSVVGSNASSPMSFNTTARAGSGEGMSRSLAKFVLASVEKGRG